MSLWVVCNVFDRFAICSINYFLNKKGKNLTLIKKMHTTLNFVVTCFFLDSSFLFFKVNLGIYCKINLRVLSLFAPRCFCRRFVLHVFSIS